MHEKKIIFQCLNNKKRYSTFNKSSEQPSPTTPDYALTRLLSTLNVHRLQ